MDQLPGIATDAETRAVLRRIDDARDEAGLQQASGAIQALARASLGRLPAQALTRLISTLNDALTRRVIDLCPGKAALDGVQWCWIALGSEGRQEQTFASDQDNGIVFGAGAGAAQVRAALLPLALRVNHMLAACGFPLCKGRVMASNPQWCLSVQEWRERFRDWIDESDPQALLNATIFFDLRPLHGDCALACSLRDWIAMNASDNHRFLYQMAENALRRRPPLGLLREFVVEREGEFAGTIDLKLQAATLFVDAARVFGLASASRSCNSAERLRHAAAARYLDPREVEGWIEAFYLVQSLRLANHDYTSAMPNRIDPGRLDASARRALVGALHQARSLQKRMQQVYPASAHGL